MTTLTRWNPFREMEQLHQELNTLLDANFGRRTNGAENLQSTGWSPPVDIGEAEKEYVLRVDLPGLTKPDVNVTFENGTLNISGERKPDAQANDWRFQRQECWYGNFNRSFTLPGDTDPDHITAEFKNGVLYVHVPKTKTAWPKQIAVS